ncbi:MAG: hypothetical protein O7J95_20000 [Planctomycetota bacterium]|nr:hypothetical protein [Planctomycetota bacterium]
MKREITLTVGLPTRRLVEEIHYHLRSGDASRPERRPTTTFPCY